MFSRQVKVQCRSPENSGLLCIRSKQTFLEYSWSCNHPSKWRINYIIPDLGFLCGKICRSSEITHPMQDTQPLLCSCVHVAGPTRFLLTMTSLLFPPHHVIYINMVEWTLAYEAITWQCCYLPC